MAVWSFLKQWSCYIRHHLKNVEYQNFISYNDPINWRYKYVLGNWSSGEKCKFTDEWKLEWAAVVVFRWEILRCYWFDIGLLATHVQKQMCGLGNMHYNKPRLSWPYIISREHQCDQWEERYTASDRQFDNKTRLLCFEDSPQIGNVFSITNVWLEA